jgi:hypothetical protein
VLDRALRAECRALVGAGDHQRLAPLADPLDEAGAVRGELAQVVAGGVAPEVRLQAVAVGRGEEQERAVGVQDADGLVERDAGQFLRIQYPRRGPADLLQGAQALPVDVVALGLGRRLRQPAAPGARELGGDPADPVRPALVLGDRRGEHRLPDGVVVGAEFPQRPGPDAGRLVRQAGRVGAGVRRKPVQRAQRAFRRTGENQQVGLGHLRAGDLQRMPGRDP